MKFVALASGGKDSVYAIWQWLPTAGPRRRASRLRSRSIYFWVYS